MSALRQEHGARERHEHRAVLLEARGLCSDDSLCRPRLRLAFFQNLGFRVDRVTNKHWRSQLDVRPSKVRNRFLAGVRDGHAGYDRECKSAVHKRLPELAVLGILVIKMQGMGVRRKKREPDIVRFRNRPTWSMLVDVTDLEIFEITAQNFTISVGSDFLHAIHTSISSALPLFP